MVISKTEYEELSVTKMDYNISGSAEFLLKITMFSKLHFLYINICIFIHIFWNISSALNIQSDRWVIWSRSQSFMELTILGRIPSFLFTLSPLTSSGSGTNSTGEKYPLVCMPFVSCTPFLIFWLLTVENTN